MTPTEVRDEWAGRSGEFSPAYYAHHGPNATSDLVRETLDERVGQTASVLELGCSSGRHLAHLHANGYEDLHGIEVNEGAREVMAEAYPELSDGGTFHFEAVEGLIEGIEDDRYDVTFAVETLQHLHPDSEWVFEELVRITDSLLVTVEHEPEGSASEVLRINDEFPLYHRDWTRIFTELGLEEVSVQPAGRDTLRAFSPPEA
ncbi:class I SAM-dependent methyltransferase [Natronorarus salvus]|uniref:class I SAM-dependent methyltransferase n=1 Tax=Natronorarus salvus TaxID=3117733 RepID=UPI002F261B2A